MPVSMVVSLFVFNLHRLGHSHCTGSGCRIRYGSVFAAGRFCTIILRRLIPLCLCLRHLVGDALRNIGKYYRCSVFHLNGSGCASFCSIDNSFCRIACYTGAGADGDRRVDFCSGRRGKGNRYIKLSVSVSHITGNCLCDAQATCGVHIGYVLCFLSQRTIRIDPVQLYVVDFQGSG